MKNGHLKKRRRIAVIVRMLLLALAAAGIFGAGKVKAAPEDAAYSAEGQYWPEAPELAGEAVVLMEAGTKAVIYEKNPEEKMYPASTTKILTALIVLEHCSLDETVVFTEECCDLEEGAVTIDSVPGEKMLLKDVMYGLLLPSGNDCAMALAIHTAGSVEAFADMMNEKAAQLGATNSHFVNPSGLFDRNHYTTASDLAKIAWYAFQNSTFVDIISHPTYVIEPTNMNPESRVLTNTHEMITPGNADYSSDVIGGKTGYLYESGRCLVTYARRNGVTLLSVILDGSYYGIFTETQELLDYGWNHFAIINIAESERRFSYADDSARVWLDTSSEILTLINVPFSELNSEVCYTWYMDADEYAVGRSGAGIGLNDNRELYAWINYSYAGHFLGRGYVYIDPALEPAAAAFIDVFYVNIVLVIIIAVLVLLAVVYVIRLARKATRPDSLHSKIRKKVRKGRIRYYNRSDSVDLRSQYVRRGSRNQETIYDLDEIGLPRVEPDSVKRRKGEKSMDRGSMERRRDGTFLEDTEDTVQPRRRYTRR